MSGRVRITVVTPSFNQAPFVAETIESVLSQGYENLEYMVVDGGSTDGSVDVIRRYAGHLAWWVSEPDHGQSHAINKGFGRATGDVLGFINSDDLLEPGCLARVAAEFERGADWVAAPARCFEAGKPNWRYEAVAETDPTDWLWRCPIPQPGCFWSASAAKRAGPLRENLRYVFDYEYWLRLRFRVGIRPRLLPTPLGAFRYHGSSKTVLESAKFEAEERRVRREYRSGLPVGQRLRAALRERRALGDRRQIVSLAQAAAGDRAGAMRNVLASIGQWPPLLVHRRTLGAMRRAWAGTGA